MRPALLLIALILLSTASAAEYSVRVVLIGYNGECLLNVTGQNFSTNFNVTNGSVISLPEGRYELKLFAMNKTFVNELNVTDNTSVTFNLLFTSSTENISLMRHIIIQPTLEVFEIILITNSGRRNFEGDLAVTLPTHRNLRIDESTLSFINYKVKGDELEFQDIIIPANSTGRIGLSYKLVSNVFELRNQKNQSLLILSALPVEKYENVVYKGVKNFESSKYEVFESSGSPYLVFKRGEFKTDPIAAAVVIILSVAVFLYFRSRSGGWK
ncbi:hypothetical protein [Archaeoglobus neptunius]|uniref:hypothetical protein n=1 Tax=Archaeoglobus neptunius TaxID=2798580 RepID=UPI001926B20C|nr:hypothetical protein [Archaeoglobus neptunius]